LDVGPSSPGGDTVTEVMWGAHSGHRSTSASRCQASSSGASTSNTRLTVALVMHSTSGDWEPPTVGDVAARSTHQPINDIAEGSPTRDAWPDRHIRERAVCGG